MAANIEDAKADYLAAKDAIGKTDAKILFVRRFKIEGKPDAKNEHKILAITSCRIFILTKKQQVAKVDFSFHILELHILDNTKPMALNITITINEKQYMYTFLYANQDDVDKSISYMMALLQSNFLNGEVCKQVILKIESDEKQKEILNLTAMIVKSLSGDTQPCGSFSLAYICMCDFYNQMSLAEVIWDVNKIYSSHNSKDFKIEDFDHLETKELIPLIAALAYNTWFTRLTISAYKLTNELVEVVTKVIKRSSTIEDIEITDAHLNKEHVTRITLALSSNPNKMVKKVDLSKNNMEDKGVSGIAGCLSTLPHGFETLCLSDIGISSKGAGILSNGLKNNKYILTSLTKLDLSSNALKVDGAQSLCDFLAQPNALESINLSYTETALDLLFGALLRGCQQNLQELSVAGNPFSYRKAKEAQSLSSFQQFFSSSRSLKNIDLSNTKIHAQAIKAILMGLISNPVLTDVGLNLSRNELKSAGSAEICSCIKEVRCLTRLNLAENGLDQDLAKICEALEESQWIKELDLSRNVSKSKYNSVISEAIADMIMSETLPLKKLSIADCKLRVDAAALFDCIGTNELLVSIDISGNGIGDIGARLIGKALQINTKLTEIFLDRNSITHKGLEDIALSMQRNFTLHSIPLPISDLSIAMKHNAEAFTKYYRKIELALIRNQSIQEASPDQAYKVHQGLLLTSIDSYTQFTDSLVVQLQDLVHKHRTSTNEDVRNELKLARNLITETDSFRQVLLELYSDPEPSRKSLNEKFYSVADDFAKVVEGVLQTNVETMLSKAKVICPNAFNNDEKLQNVKEGLIKEGLIDKAAVHNSIVTLAKADIMFKLCESTLSTASNLVEILKKILIESLQETINKLSSISEETVEPTKKEESVKEEKDDQVVVEEEKKNENVEEEKKSDVGEEKENEDKVVVEERKEDQKKEEKVEDLPKDEKKESAAVEEKDEDKESKQDTADLSIDIKEVAEKSSEQVEPKKNETDALSATPSSPSITISTPVQKMFGQISTDESFDLPWEFTAGSRISMTLTNEEEKDDDCSLVASKARSRLSTIAQSDIEKRRKKRASVKRRPTFYREPEKAEAIEIDLGGEKKIDSGAEKKVEKRLSKPKPAASTDDVDAPQSRPHLPSVGAFDAVSSSATSLKVTTDRVRPVQGRRAPSRVSNLAHMNTESTEKYIEEQSTSSASPKPSPRQRPVSAMPAMASSVSKDNSVSPRAGSEKLKPKPTTNKKTEKDKKPESKKEKKGKPIGGIQLPSLPGFLKRKDRGSSKVDHNEEIQTKPADTVDGNRSETEHVIKEESPAEASDTTTKEQKEPGQNTEEKPAEKPPAPSKPEPAKRAPMIPKAGLPVAGGSALLAEMKKRQNKGEESKPAAPTPSSKPHRGSISKPPPPKRPPSLRKPNVEGKAVVPERPKPPQRPIQESEATDSTAETSHEQNSNESESKEIKTEESSKDGSKEAEETTQEESKKENETKEDPDTSNEKSGQVDFI